MAISGTDWLEVPNIYKAYVSAKFPPNMAKNMVLTYLHFRILEFPLIRCYFLRHGGLRRNSSMFPGYYFHLFDPMSHLFDPKNQGTGKKFLVR